MKKILILLASSLTLFGAANDILIQSGNSSSNRTTARAQLTAGTNLLVGTVTSSNLTALKPVLSDSGKKLVSGTNTGSGSFVFSEAPTIADPTFTGTLTFPDSSLPMAKASGTLDEARIDPDIARDTEITEAISANNALRATIAQLEALLGVDITLKSEIDSQAGFEAYVGWPLPFSAGASADDVYIEDGQITHPNLRGSASILVVITGTNVTWYATNLTSAEIGNNAIAASELDESAVQTELEGVIRIQQLQGQATDSQMPPSMANKTFTGTFTAPDNSIALGTKTTGSYAAGDAEAGSALSGDSATGFFPTGTLEDARLPSSMANKTFTGTFTIPNNSVALGTQTTGNYAAGDAEAGAALTGDSATDFFSTGQFAIARLASGTPDGTKFIRDDGVLATPPGSGGGSAPTGTVVTAGAPAAGTLPMYGSGHTNIVPSGITVTGDDDNEIAIETLYTGDLIWSNAPISSILKTDGSGDVGAAVAGTDYVAPTGSGATLTVVASGFNGNLTTSDNTLQEIVQKLDDLSASGSANITDSDTNIIVGGEVTTSKLNVEQPGEWIPLSSVTDEDDTHIWTQWMHQDIVTNYGTVHPPHMLEGIMRKYVSGTNEYWTNAIAGTHYAPITTGSSILKGNGAGGTTAAVAGTDLTGVDVVTATQSITSQGFVDVTDMSFAVVSGTTYEFEMFVVFQSSATTMGVLLGLNGPAITTLVAQSRKQITVGGTATADMFSEAILSAYDTPLPNSTAEPAADVNLLCTVRGIIKCSGSGTFTLRLSKENVAGTARIMAGSHVKWKAL